MDTDVSLRDTPALAALARRQAKLGHIDPAALTAAQELLRAAKRILGAFAEAFAEHGLSPGRYALLMALDVERPSLAPSAIAERLGVTRATVTGLVDGLVRDGLVAYAPEAGDRRRKAVSLTPRGEALIEAVLPDIYRQMVGMTAPLSPEECRQAVQLMGRIEGGLISAGRTEANPEGARS